MNKKKPVEKGSSIKTAIFFGIGVFLLVTIALIIRMGILIKDAKYDGKHRFTVLVDNGKRGEIISYDPQKHNYSVLQITDIKNNNSLISRLGVGVDTKVKNDKNYSDAPISSVFADIFFSNNYDTSTMNSYDLGRLFLASLFSSSNNNLSEKISLNADDTTIDTLITKLFPDTDIIMENKSISIVNSTDVSGIGSKLERVIKNIGGNVIAVTNGQLQKNGNVMYYGDASYTAIKLQKLTHMKLIKTEQKSVSDIIIVVGTNELSGDIFK